MKKLSRKSVVIIGIALLGFVIVAIPKFGFGPIGLVTKFKSGMKAKGFYYCPMHPSYTSDRPGDCPICSMKLVSKKEVKGKKERKILYYRHPMGQPDVSPVPKKDSMGMDYIPVYEDEVMESASKVQGYAMVRIPLEKQQVIGVKLGTVEKRKLAKEIRTVGRVAFDPELYTAQQEFLSAFESLGKAKGGPYHEPLERSESLLESTKVRLRLLGMSDAEIAELKKEAVRDRNLILPTNDFSSLRGSGSSEAEAISSPEIASLPAVARNDAKRVQTEDRARDSYVWVYGTIYEYEIPFVRVESEVRVSVPTFPDREFSGEVRALDPVLDPKTRSIRIRARVGNPEGLLKPEMYVDLYLKTEGAEALVVPEEAVMQTGERVIIFVAQGEGYFEPHEVKLGIKSGKVYEVKEGLKEGERIVVSGNFLIDSESRLQAALSGMGGGHQHGA